MCITWLQLRNHLNRFGPNFSPTWPIQLAPAWSPVGSKTPQLGPKLGQVGPLWEPGVKLGLTRANFADSMWHAENLCFYCYFLRFLLSLGLCWAQLRHPNVPKLRHVGPQLGSSWSQLARVRRKLRPSWTQVGSCSVELRAKDGQVWPQSTFGWAK